LTFILNKCIVKKNNQNENGGKKYGFKAGLESIFLMLYHYFKTTRLFNHCRMLHFGFEQGNIKHLLDGIDMMET
jgi:hypothetical protein